MIMDYLDLLKRQVMMFASVFCFKPTEKMSFLLTITLISALCESISIKIDTNAEWETVWNYTKQHCPPSNGTGTDNPNNNPRAFITGDNKTIEFLSSSSSGFYQRRGTSFSNLTSICDKPVIVSGDVKPYATPQEFNNGIWIQATWRDRQDPSKVHAIIHNEFHGGWQVNTSLCPSGEDKECWYWNGLCAYSNDGGDTFKLYDLPQRECIGTPFKYIPDGGGQTMSPFSNIISKDGYLYLFVNRNIRNGYKQGICLYRIYEQNITDPTQWRAYNNNTGEFDIKSMLDPYMSDDDPNEYVCSTLPILRYAFSWSYNNVLNMYIHIGLNMSNGEISYSVSKDMLKWSEYETIISLNGTYKEYEYPAILDETSEGVNFEFSNEFPYLYVAKTVPNEPVYNRDILRIRLKVQS